MLGKVQRVALEEILSEKQIHHVLKQSIGDDVPFDLKGSELKPAVDGIAGFLGDHMKAVLHVDVKGEMKKVPLFLKCIPTWNKPKADFIDVNNYYRREVLMYKVLEEICVDDPEPWGVKAYIYADTTIVMPDLSLEGYAARHFLDNLDPQHFFIATTTIARFHAAFVNYETKKSIELNRPYSTFQEFGHLLAEPTYCDSPWLKTAAKLTADILKTFSTKAYRNLPDLESKLAERYIEACDSLTEYKDSVNVLLHKDLWVNNIMFKYENGAPVNAVLVDYQCLRYGPPAFDLMIMLYLTTDRSFRKTYEREIFDHYYSVFAKDLNEDSKKRLKDLGYDKEDFLRWCEKGRMFGMFEAAGIYPYIFMDPKTAEKTFDDPETYEKHVGEDRSEPILAHALECNIYRERNLDISEEFVETYVLKQI